MNKAEDDIVFSKREVSFIESRDSFFMVTVGENSWPYVQHRGGPRGFLKIINSSTFGYGIYHDGVMFGLVENDTRYLKADETTQKFLSPGGFHSFNMTEQAKS